MSADTTSRRRADLLEQPERVGLAVLFDELPAGAKARG
jgi:hypothetical protein